MGLSLGFLSGQVPTGASSAAYSQNTYSAWFNALAFAEPTVFGTLLGFEFNAALGLRTVSKPDAVADPEGRFEGISPTGRMDFEFAYDLVHWKLLSLRQRVILDVGGGFELNSHRLRDEPGRALAQLDEEAEAMRTGLLTREEQFGVAAALAPGLGVAALGEPLATREASSGRLKLPLLIRGVA